MTHVTFTSKRFNIFTYFCKNIRKLVKTTKPTDIKTTKLKGFLSDNDYMTHS